MKIYLSIILICLIGCAGENRTAEPASNAAQETEQNQIATQEVERNTLTESQEMRLFMGEWYPDYKGSVIYRPNSDDISQIGHYFDDHVNPFHKTYIAFHDYGYSVVKRKTAVSEQFSERVKLKKNGPVDWSEHVASIDNDHIAIKIDGIWIVCDHWQLRE